MSSACQFSVGCIDTHVPVHPAANLHKWAESDAQFVRSLASPGGPSAALGISPRSPWLSPTVVDSYSCRQRFLRSYTFSKKETVPEKTVKCLGKAKERAADIPCFRFQRMDGGESLLMNRKRYKPRSRNKKEPSLFRCLFYRLLSCTSSFDVVDRNSVVHAL